MPHLNHSELAVLRLIHEADRDRGGIALGDLSDDEADVCGQLVERGLAETLSEFGEAPDGEEDERDAGGHHVFRMTGRGVDALAEVRDRQR